MHVWIGTHIDEKGFLIMEHKQGRELVDGRSQMDARAAPEHRAYPPFAPGVHYVNVLHVLCIVAQYFRLQICQKSYVPSPPLAVIKMLMLVQVPSFVLAPYYG